MGRALLPEAHQDPLARAVRLIRRKHTRLAQPRPPWEWRDTAERGAPRTLLSNHKNPVMVSLGDTRVTAGRLDWMLRLYQHQGATKQSKFWQDEDGNDYVAYFPDEWEKVRDVAEWLELVDTDHESVWRTGIRSARKYGHTTDTARGPMWVVPLEHYSSHESE